MYATKIIHYSLDLRAMEDDVTQEAQQPTASESPSSSSPSSFTSSSAFKHRSTKYRSLAQAVKSLPHSPRIRSEIVKLIASKHFKIQFKSKGGRTKQTLSNTEEEWLFSFRQTPGRKDHVYIGKVDGERKYMQKRYLQWTIRELFGIINGKVPMEECQTFPNSFDRELTFRQLYDFLKKHKQYKYSSQTPNESCTCEICENITLITSAVNRKLKNIDAKLPVNVKELVGEYSCDVSNADCMKSICLNCPALTIEDSDFKDSSSTASSDSEESSSNDNSDKEDECDEIKYYQWLSIEGKANKVCICTGVDDVKQILLDKIRELKLHVYVKNEQYDLYNQLKNEMPANAMLVHVDYAESYENKQQDECQSAYFLQQLYIFAITLFY